MVSVIGCSLSLNFVPWLGDTIPGAEISTPAIGLATVGAVGLELLAVSQPPSVSRSRPQARLMDRDLMTTSKTDSNASNRIGKAAARGQHARSGYRIRGALTLGRKRVAGRALFPTARIPRTGGGRQIGRASCRERV